MACSIGLSLLFCYRLVAKDMPARSVKARSDLRHLYTEEIVSSTARLRAP
jgi:hypothetical protein